LKFRWDDKTSHAYDFRNAENREENKNGLDISQSKSEPRHSPSGAPAIRLLGLGQALTTKEDIALRKSR
jgi:hypothetical protein